MKTKTHPSLMIKTVITSGFSAALLLGTGVARAQLGTGWTQQNYSERFEYHHTGGPTIETISPAPAGFADDYIAYTNVNNTRYFWFKNTTAGRAEIRVNNDYTTGRHQFEGYLTFFKPSSMLADYQDTVVNQDFGADTHAAWKLEVRTNNNGSLTAEGPTIQTGVYGQTHRINIMHYVDDGTIQVFVDGMKLYDQADQGGTNHYTKYGMYGGHVVAHDIWKNPKYFTGGNKPNNINLDTTAIYQLQNVASGLVLNQQGSLTNGSKITQWSSGSTSQNLQWKFIDAGNGYYQINSVKSGKDAVVQSASTSAGAGIIQWSFGSAGNDLWTPTLNIDGTYTFANQHSGLVLEDPGSSTSTSTQMDQWGSTGGSNQKWNLIKQ